MSIRRPALVFDNVTVITNAILRDPKLSPAEKGLLGYVLSHAAGYELTMKQMIAENRAGRELLDSALKGLEARGYLKRTRKRSETGQLGGYDWEVTIDAVGHPVGASVPKASVGNPTVDATSGNAEFEQVATSAGKPNVASASLGKPAPKKFTGLELELDLELKEQTPSSPAAPDPFAVWWKLYPKKVSKNTADRAYRKAHKAVGAEVLLDGLKRYIEWLGPDADHQYTAHPSTWLNGKRWDDELPAKRANPNGNGLIERDGMMLTRANAEAWDLLQEMRLEEAVASVALSRDPHMQTHSLDDGRPW